MRCDEIQVALSCRLDGEPVSETPLDDHLRGCADCQAFMSAAYRARRQFRLSPLGDDIPDITADVVAQLPATPDVGRPRRRWRATAPMAASLVVGLAIGGLLAGASQRQPSIAEEMGERVLAAQATVTDFDATISITERGWHEDVPVRRYEGVLRYSAPEELVIELRDRTAYPDGPWVANDVTRVVTRAAEWSTATPDCPRSQVPACLQDAPRTTGVTDRVPLSGLGARALDVVVPVQSFALGGGTDLGTRNGVDGAQVGVTADVAQLAPLLDALVGAGNWREFHPADQVELWVDAVEFTPREVIVRVGDGFLRERWAAQRGLADHPGDVVLEVLTTPTDPKADDALPSPPNGLRSAGFEDGEADLPLPQTLPPGMQPHRRGHQTTSEYDVATVTWTDGRAWLRLRGVRQWSGGRLFGDLGDLVRRVALPDGRIVYVSGEGSAVAIHTDRLDLLLEGSVGREALVDVAASIDVDGRRVPRDWAEAANSTMTEAVDALPGLLLPSRLVGFGPFAIQVGDDQVVIGQAGSGGRELVVTQRSGNAVSPPVVADVIGVDVRGHPGRYLPDSGELEWVEDGIVVSVRSDDLGLLELLQVAAGLRVAS